MRLTLNRMPLQWGGVPTGYRHTAKRALTAIDIRWLHSAANDGRPISRMSCYASALKYSLDCPIDSLYGHSNSLISQKGLHDELNKNDSQ